ncbi:MAG: GDSL-type esterase/lipase family protein, partial [Bacteroidota bacterium]|nr:GDSL-type esterase/lipase family protein [Bacteroidota bacterium]
VTDNHGVSDSTPATVTITVQSSVDALIVDNTDPGFSTSGTWPHSSSIPGYYGSDYQYGDPNTFSGTATWFFYIQKSKYTIYAQWTSFSNRAANAKYVIKNNGTEIDAVCANQQFNGGMFNVLGTYSLESGTLEVVLNHDTDGIVIADAVKIENKFNTKPSVYIETPSDYHLQVSRDLDVCAHVNPLNDISNYGVLFVLDEDSGPSHPEVLDLNPPFEVTFYDVSLAEHQINAYLTDAAGDPIVGNATQDVVYNVGVGDYYVAMGDSITHGFADDDALDDVSLDGRNDGGGYSPVLNDLLTSTTMFPHAIENEGVPGAVSADGVVAISNLLTKHAQAVRFLILYGTNDVGMMPPVPSGRNLYPGDPDYPGTFKANIQQIIEVINNDGKEACIAKVPVQLADCSGCEWYSEPDNGARNAIVKDYNIALRELKDYPGNNINVVPPDFYIYYLNNYQTEYADWLHPNGAGYQSMADMWEQVLTQ